MRLTVAAVVAAWTAAAAAQEPASPRWSGSPEYRRFAGATTAAGPEHDASWALVYPAQGVRRGTVVLLPGLLLGATSFDALARRLVVAAPGWEVWAWDRRANGLEDRSGFAAGDPWAYYRRFTQEAPAFLKEWGLAVHLADLDRVVDEARDHGPVVLAGHSIGAGLAGAYALAHDEKLAGLVLLDGAPRESDRVARRAYEKGHRTLFRYVPGLEDIESGAAPPNFEVFDIGPRQLAEGEAIAARAAADPDGDAPADAAAWPASNAAAALVRISGRYTPFPLLAVTVGRATGRDWIDPVGLFMGRISFRVKGPRDDRVEWQDADDPTSAAELLHSFAWPETGFFEWFMPYRLVLDLTGWDLAVSELRPRRHHFPVLGIGAGEGMIPRASGFAGVLRAAPGTALETVIVTGVTHLDLLTGRRGPAVGPLARYLARIAR